MIPVASKLKKVNGKKHRSLCALLLAALALLGLFSPLACASAEREITGESTCTLYIECKTILDNMQQLNPDKLEVLPEDGVIIERCTVAFEPGESVYDMLVRETKARRIHMEAEYTPIYDSAYVEGINNLYEFDCGEGSGWTYSVNGKFPNYGCSKYKIENGDVIEWRFTCDYGRDVGCFFE